MTNIEINIKARRQPRYADYRMSSPSGRSSFDARGFGVAEREYRSETRVYFFHSGETILGNLLNRRSRPTDIYRSYMGPVLEALGLPANTKYRWSSKAGCKMCPCSPGFIIEGDHQNRDAYVTLSDSIPTTTRVFEAV